MTKQEMKDKATEALRSYTGYHFQPKVVDSIIDAGEIPVGANLGRGAEWDGSQVIIRKPDGSVQVAAEASEGTTERALIAYAVLQAWSR